MKKLVMAGAALAMMASTAIAERYVMITHTQGTDPFWPVVEKGGRDAAAAIGQTLNITLIHLVICQVWQSLSRQLPHLTQTG